MNTELHPFVRSDFKALISWIRNPYELFMWSADTFKFPLDENQLEQHYQDVQRSNTRLMYKAIDTKTQENVGHVELVRIDREKRKASIAFVLVDPNKRGCGYGTAMIQDVLQEGFHQMKMMKMDLFVFQSNTVAMQCYQKIGFGVEQEIKDKIKWNEEFMPLYLMGLDYERWLAIK